MNTWIKICGLSEPETLDAAVCAGVDAVGFVFAKSVRQISPERAFELSQHLPSTTATVAVFLRPFQAQIDAVLEHFTPTYVQADWQALQHIELPKTVKRLPVYRQGVAMPDDCGYPAEILYEGTTSGHGQTIDWHDAHRVARSTNLILAGGLTPENVGEAVALVRPFGVDVSSGVEASPGRKCDKLIAEFVDAIRTFDQQENQESPGNQENQENPENQ